MVRNTLLAASALALAAAALTGGPASAWPFGASKPAAAPAKAAAAAAAAPEPVKKASAAERASADRLDPLGRSVFWAREAGLDPSDAEAGIHLAAALRALGQYQEGSEAIAKVLVIYPANLEALLESARCSVSASKGFYAIEPLRQAEAIAPRDWRVYSLMAVARDQNQQPDAARTAYGQALALSPDNPAVLTNLGLWYASHGQPAQGETYLRRAVAAPGSSAQERQNLALVLGMEGKLSDAERLMREDLPPDQANENLAYLRSVSGPRSP